MRILPSILALLLVPALALAADGPNLFVQTHGRLLGDGDQPVEGSQELRFQLFSNLTPEPGETALWEETYTVNLSNGIYAVELGHPDRKALPASVFGASSVFLQVSVGGVALSPRQRVGAVPVAGVALGLNCVGCITKEHLGFEVDAIAEGAIGAAQLADGAVGSDALADGAVGTGQLVDGAVTDAKLANGIDGAKLSAGSVTNAALANGIDGAKLQAGSVPSSALTELDGSLLLAGSVGNEALANGIDGAKLTAGSVPGSALAIAGKSCSPGMVVSGFDANGQLECVPALATPPLPVVALTAEGLSSISRSAASGYSTIPDLDLSFSLDGDYVVLVEMDFTVVPNGANNWAGFRLDVDGAPDERSTHVEPSAAGEEAHIHLFRIAELSKGDHRIRAQWGEGAGTISSSAGNTSYATAPWTRRMTVLAIPKDRGVKYGYAQGLTTVCRTGTSTASWTDVPGLKTDISLSEPSVVLSLGDMNVVGGSSAYASFRLVVGTNADPTSMSLQPIGSGNEDVHASLFRVNTLAAGTHPLAMQWGYGTGEMCNNAGDPGKLWTRRLGWIAIPESAGVKAAYLEPQTNARYTAATGYTQIPGLHAELSLPSNKTWVALTKTLFSFDPAANGSWLGVRLNVDGKADARAVHAQPSHDSQDSAIGTHRIDYLGIGAHSFRAEWGDGSGSPYSNGAGVDWTRRLGVIVLPVEK